MNEQYNSYLIHLLSSISYHKKNTLDQKGKSDIETFEYDDSVNLWFGTLIDLINEYPPEYYVAAINVYELNQNIEKIEYDYFDTVQDENTLIKATINLAKHP